MRPLLIPKMRVLMQMCCAAKQRRNMPASPPTRLFPVTIITGFTAALPHSRRPPLFFHIHPHSLHLCTWALWGPILWLSEVRI